MTSNKQPKEHFQTFCSEVIDSIIKEIDASVVYEGVADTLQWQPFVQNALAVIYSPEPFAEVSSQFQDLKNWLAQLPGYLLADLWMYNQFVSESLQRIQHLPFVNTIHANTFELDRALLEVYRSQNPKGMNFNVLPDDILFYPETINAINHQIGEYELNLMTPDRS